MAQLNFDATQVEPDVGFDVVPAGWYNVMADESDLKPTKNDAGTYLQIRFNILDGQYKGRKLFARLNIRNANAQTQEIALRQLSAIGHAVGVLHIQDSQQLHGLPLKVKVKIRPAEGQYDEQNDIISYKNINEPVTTVGTTPAAASPMAQQGFVAPPQQPPAGFAPPVQQQFAPPVQQQFAPQPPQQFAPQPQQPQQFQQPPAQEQPMQPPAQQPWAQPPIQQTQPPQQDPGNPFQQQQPPVQPQQQQTWQQPQQAQQPPQQPQDPHAGAAAQAQAASPPWAQQTQPQQ
jgi:hypothetical protein